MNRIIIILQKINVKMQIVEKVYIEMFHYGIIVIIKVRQKPKNLSKGKEIAYRVQV